MNLTIKQGDRRPPIKAVLADAVGPLDLAHAVVTFRMRKGGGSLISGECTIVDAAAGSVAYYWGPTDTAEVGTYSAEFRVTFDDGSYVTCPNDRNLSVTVMAGV